MKIHLVCFMSLVISSIENSIDPDQFQRSQLIRSQLIRICALFSIQPTKPIVKMESQMNWLEDRIKGGKLTSFLLEKFS